MSLPLFYSNRVAADIPAAGRDAERPGLRTHAERRYEWDEMRTHAERRYEWDEMRTHAERPAGGGHRYEQKNPVSDCSGLQSGRNRVGTHIPALAITLTSLPLRIILGMLLK
jgi:hypothetical protein